MPSLSDLSTGDERLRSDLRAALAGGLVAALVMGALVFAIGSVGSGEAHALLEASLPTARFLASAVMTVSATTLALMLTLLSMSAGVEREIKGSHYERIRQIAFVDVVAFVGATLLLVALVVPVDTASQIPGAWYVGLYYGVSLWSAALGGVLVAVMILLYAAVRDVISVVTRGAESPLVDGEPAGDRDAADGQSKAASASRSASS